MIELRPLRWWQIAAVARLEREIFTDTAWSAEQFWAELAQPNRRYTVALRRTDGSGDGPDDGAGDDPDGGVVGYAGVWCGRGEADVQTIAVAPSARGAGLGRALLHRLLGQAAEAGAEQVLLEVRADNTAAIELYCRNGFEQLSVRPRYYQPGDVDALVMRLRVPPSASNPSVGEPDHGPEAAS